MTELLQFDSRAGPVLVEVTEVQSAPVMRGGRTEAAVMEARESLEGLLRRLGPVVRGVVAELRKSGEWPDELEIEFAVKVTADANVIIARGGGEANFRIAMRWSGDGAS